MNIFLTISGIAAIALLPILLISYICFRMVFYVPRKNETPSEEIPVPAGKIYEPYHDMMRQWIKEARGYKNEDFYIKSHDGLTLPADLVYPFIKLGVKLYGHFDLEEYTPLEAMKTCKLPVIFFHGESDAFVPYHMSRECYQACQSPKKLVTVPKAGHGLVYVIDNDLYFNSVVKFFTENGTPTKLHQRPM